jgi:hypothetical protein
VITFLLKFESSSSKRRHDTSLRLAIHSSNSAIASTIECNQCAYCSSHSQCLHTLYIDVSVVPNPSVIVQKLTTVEAQPAPCEELARRWLKLATKHLAGTFLFSLAHLIHLLPRFTHLSVASCPPKCQAITAQTQNLRLPSLALIYFLAARVLTSDTFTA